MMVKLYTIKQSYKTENSTQDWRLMSTYNVCALVGILAKDLAFKNLLG